MGQGWRGADVGTISSLGVTYWTKHGLRPVQRLHSHLLCVHGLHLRELLLRHQRLILTLNPDVVLLISFCTYRSPWSASQPQCLQPTR